MKDDNSKSQNDQEDVQDSTSPKLISNNRILIGIIVILSVVIIGLAGYLITYQKKAPETITITKIPVEVKSFSPSGKVPQKTNFTITFSQNMVSESSVNVQLDSVPVEITPRIPGKYRWLNKNKLGFFPDIELYPSTEYTAEILPELCTADNLYLTGQTQFKFHTPRFTVKDSLVSFDFSDKDKNSTKVKIAVEFNYPVHVGTLEKNLSVLHENDEIIPYNIITEKNTEKVIELKTEEIAREEYEKRIKLKIDKNLKCVDGILGLDGDYISYITLKSQKPLRVERVSSEEQAGKSYISIRFSSPLDSDVAKEYIDVVPETEYRISSNYRYLELRGDFHPGEVYTVSVKKGLYAQDDSVLKRDYSTQVKIKDLKPSIGFVGDGIYLSRDGNLNIGLSTVNVDEVQMEIDKVFANNLVYLISSGNMNRRYFHSIQNFGKEIYQGELSIDSKRNQEVVTPINLREYLSNERLGIFRISAYQKDKRWHRAFRWVMITDLGIVAKKNGDEMLVWINSLSSLKPIQNAEVKLISRNNQILLTGTTNREGIVRFSSIKDKIKDFTPFLLTALKYGDGSSQNDLSFLELRSRRISTADFDVGGKQVLKNGYDAFVYTDRGIYRPGENAKCIAIVRDAENKVPPKFPIKVQVISPDRRIFREFLGNLNREGALEFNIELPEYIKTGKYNAKVVVAEKEIGRTDFSVEEFMPDRIKVKVKTDKDAVNLGEEVQIDVKAEYLFGPPVKSGETSADCIIEARRFSRQEWNSFTFADVERSYERQEVQLGEAILDESGEYTYTLKVPTGLKPPSSLRGVISATVKESGGRAVSAYKTIDIHPYSHYVGIRREEKGHAKPGENTEIEYIVVDHDGNAVAGRKLKVSFYYIRWHSILRWRDGRYRYVSEHQKELLKSFTVNSEKDISSFQFKPDRYGKYLVEIADESGSSASTDFYASGWGYAPWAMENPDKLKVEMDRESYSPGDIAKALIKSPFSGKLILTVERDGIYSYRILTMEENTAEVEVPVTEQYAPNVYVSATLIRSTSSLERHAPARAFGVVPLVINTEENRLAITLDTVDEIRPKKELTINFKVENINLQNKSYVTVAAVDEGICQLTDFKTPKPYEYFFGKRQLSVTSYDIYSAVLPEIEPASSSSNTGGDEAEEDYRKKHLSPVGIQRVKPVALWSGLIEADEYGSGTVTFKIPQFNGSLRLMVVAFSGDKFGSTSKNVTVREPVMLMPTYPRFVSGGDTFEIPVTVFNYTGGSGEFEVKLEVIGPVKIVESQKAGKPESRKTGNTEISRKVNLEVQNENQQIVKIVSIEDDASGQVFWKVKAHKSMGKATFNLSAKGEDENTSRTTDIPVRPAVPPITKTGSGVVTSKQPAEFELPSNWVKNTTEFRIILSSFPAVKFANSLRYLVGYPYGCIEQTTSKLFPMLYFDDIVRTVQPELFKATGVDYYIEEGITKLQNMQLPSGAFSYWPGTDDVNAWGSIYTSHFLIEARKAGYQIPSRVYNGMLEWLKSKAKQTPDSRNRIQTITYACYVLAMAGEPELSPMLYLKNNKLNDMRTSTQFQLAGAFAFAGDMETAHSLLPTTVTMPEVERETGGNFDSSIRTRAIMLSILAEFDENHPAVPALVESLTESASKHNRWYTTQENAFAFLALGKILRKKTSQKYKGTIKIDGQHFADFDSTEQRFEDSDWAGKEVVLNIEDEGTCYYYWQAFGIPIDEQIEEYDQDLKVRRRYLNRNGEPVSYNTIHQGDVIVSEINITALKENLENVIVVDMLPAGLEIENPRLQSRAGISWIADKNYKPDYMDIRDDRLIIFGDFPRQKEQTFYYVLRAVTKGDFLLPPVKAEAMYAPTKSSVASSGSISVVY